MLFRLTNLCIAQHDTHISTNILMLITAHFSYCSVGGMNESGNAKEADEGANDKSGHDGEKDTGKDFCDANIIDCCALNRGTLKTALQL